MDPQSPTLPTPPQPATPPPPKKNHALTIILSVFLIIATAIAALLYFQNQKLIKELKQYQTSMVTPTPFPSPTPTQSLSSEEVGACRANFPVETNTPELTANQNYAAECSSKRTESDCLSIDLYNTGLKDFSKPDGVPDCVWTAEK